VPYKDKRKQSLAQYKYQKSKKGKATRSKYLRSKNAQTLRILRDNKLKEEVLTHYSKSGHLNCCWKSCCVSDLDMLSLDHIKDDGSKDRKQNNFLTGIKWYRWLRIHGFPKGLQTLCWNHQWKKRLGGRYALVR